MKWVKKGAYIRHVDDETAVKLKAQGFEPFEVSEKEPEPEKEPELVKPKKGKE